MQNFRRAKPRVLASDSIRAHWGPGFAKIAAGAVQFPRLGLPSQRNRCEPWREAQGPPLPNHARPPCERPTPPIRGPIPPVRGKCPEGTKGVVRCPEGTEGIGNCPSRRPCHRRAGLGPAPTRRRGRFRIGCRGGCPHPPASNRVRFWAGRPASGPYSLCRARRPGAPSPA